jgi:hypothetical protein
MGIPRRNHWRSLSELLNLVAQQEKLSSIRFAVQERPAWHHRGMAGIGWESTSAPNTVNFHASDYAKKCLNY